MYLSYTTGGISRAIGTVLEASYVRAQSGYSIGGAGCSSVTPYLFGSGIPIKSTFGDMMAVEYTHIHVDRPPIPGCDSLKPSYYTGSSYIGIRIKWS